MEVRINKEVRSYTEAIFFGLNPRQFVFSAIACVAALITYFVASRFFNTEIVSWLCILAALPFGALGFITFQQMKTEDILKHFIYSIILQSRDLIDKPWNLYYEISHEIRNKDRKESLEYDKKLLKALKAEQRKVQSTKNRTGYHPDRHDI